METASRQVHSKFESARLVLGSAAELALGADTAGALDALVLELGGLEVNLVLSTSHLWVYALAGETDRLSAGTEYLRIISSEDFAGNVDKLVARGEALLREAGVPLRDANAAEKKRGRGRAAGNPGKAPARTKHTAASCAAVQKHLDAYPRKGAAPVGVANDYESCPACGGGTAVDAARSMLRCRRSSCGALSELVGIAFDDSQFYSQEGQKAKSGTFNPNRHFQFWWTHILALEPEEEIGDKDDPDNQYGEKLLEKLRAIVVRDKLILRLLDVNKVRAMLREIGHTELNKNVPLLMKKLTGVGPPQISEAFAVRVENLFTKAIETRERIQRPERVNRNYYPYYINQIVVALTLNDDPERRVLYYIYIQSKETVEEDDEEWERICKEMGELQYRPTDRYLGQKYAPS